jgi:hypothetical protein
MGRLISKKEIAGKLYREQIRVFKDELHILTDGTMPQRQDLVERMLDFSLQFLDDHFVYAMHLSFDHTGVFVVVGDMSFTGWQDNIMKENVQVLQ